jgi:hypothetical protein
MPDRRQSGRAVTIYGTWVPRFVGDVVVSGPTLRVHSL